MTLKRSKANEKRYWQWFSINYSKLFDVLQKEGLNKISVNSGDEFDVNQHEAISQIPTKNRIKREIVEEIESGYIQWKIIRFNKVVIGKWWIKEITIKYWVTKKCKWPRNKKSLSKLAIKYHPDKNPDNKEAEEKFKETQTYSVLSNDEKEEGMINLVIEIGGNSGFSRGNEYEDIFDSSVYFGGFSGFEEEAIVVTEF